MARILVIEDDPSMNSILVSTLSDEDHDVSSALTGDEGVEMCRTMPFDLVITDVRLPGIDGVEAISLIRSVQAGPKVIVITGYASADTPVRSIRLKVDDYLYKPFSLQYFLGTVNRVLDQERKKKKKRALVSRLFSILGGSGEKARDRKLEELVEARQEAYRMLYLGLRSEYLNATACRNLYCGLERQEAAFRRLTNAEEPTDEAIQDMTAAYNTMLDRLAIPLPGETVPTSELTADEFQTLYEATKSSAIGLDDLMHAPLLRNTPDERFETLPELLALKRQLWPSPDTPV